MFALERDGDEVAARIGETTYRSALPEGYRYGNRSVRDWTEGRHFSVIVMHFGACKGGTQQERWQGRCETVVERGEAQR